VVDGSFFIVVDVNEVDLVLVIMKYSDPFHVLIIGVVDNIRHETCAKYYS
jgi:hypothetical protein